MMPLLFAPSSRRTMLRAKLKEYEGKGKKAIDRI
jgi:hypothetical protein